MGNGKWEMGNGKCDTCKFPQSPDVHKIPHRLKQSIHIDNSSWMYNSEKLGTICMQILSRSNRELLQAMQVCVSPGETVKVASQQKLESELSYDLA